MKVLSTVAGFPYVAASRPLQLGIGMLLGVCVNAAALDAVVSAQGCGAAPTAIADVLTHNAKPLSSAVAAALSNAFTPSVGETTIRDVLTGQILSVSAPPAGDLTPFNARIPVAALAAATAPTASSGTQIIDVLTGARLAIAPPPTSMSTAETQNPTTILDVITRASVLLSPTSISTNCVGPALPVF